MKPKILLHLLHLIFALALSFYVGKLLFGVYMNTCWDKDPEEMRLPDHKFNYTLRHLATIYEEDGFKIPVKMNFHYSDTIVQYAGQLNNAAKENDLRRYSHGDVDVRDWRSSWHSGLSRWQQRVVSKYDSIYQVDTFITRAIISSNGDERDYWEGEKVEERYQNSVLDFANIEARVKSWTYVKAKQNKHFWLLLMRSNLYGLFYLFLFYQLFMIVTALKVNFTISKKIYKRVGTTGIVLSVFVILQFLLDHMVSSIYDFISIESMSTAQNYIEGFCLYMYGYAEFNFHIFSTGLLLVALSVLMKRSSGIEDDWSLTI